MPVEEFWNVISSAHESIGHFKARVTHKKVCDNLSTYDSSTSSSTRYSLCKCVHILF